jgi:hypothetical protein
MAPPALLSRLGLAGDLSLETVGRVPHPTVSEPSASDAVARGAHAPSACERSPVAYDDLSDVLVWRSQVAPGVLRVESPGFREAVTVGDAVRVGPETLVIAAVEGLGARVGSLIFSCDSGEFVIERVPVAEVEAQELGVLSRAARNALAPAPAITAARSAELQAIFSPMELDGWLLDFAAELSSRGAPLGLAQAVGLLARLAEPAIDATREMLDAIRQGDHDMPSPRALARAWWGSTGSARTDALVRDALDEISRARDGLTALGEALEADAPAARALARRWILERDDLESVRAVLALGGRDTPLHAPLASLDADASTLGTVWSALGPFDDSARLRAVSWQHPHLWWSGLGV